MSEREKNETKRKEKLVRQRRPSSINNFRSMSLFICASILEIRQPIFSPSMTRCYFDLSPRRSARLVVVDAFLSSPSHVNLISRSCHPMGQVSSHLSRIIDETIPFLFFSLPLRCVGALAYRRFSSFEQPTNHYCVLLCLALPCLVLSNVVLSVLSR